MNYFPAVVRFFFLGVLIIILPFTTNPSFVTAKEHCPKLTEPENGEMDGSCKYATSGKKCKFRCKKGYALVGKTPLTCLENLTWNDVQPNCGGESRPRSTAVCPKLTKPENGEMDGFCKYATSGKKCKFICKEGYILVGKTPLTCLENLTWNDVQPNCRGESRPRSMENCPVLTEPKNGYTAGACKDAASGEMCRFHCDQGYIQEGADTLTCLEDLSWNADKPYCRKTSMEYCPELTTPENGKMFGSCKDATRGEECKFYCKKGYVLDGKTTLTCLQNSGVSWNYEQPHCRKKTMEYYCSGITELENGYLAGTCEDATSGDKCRFKCYRGFILEGEDELTCLEDLFWNDEEPYCRGRHWLHSILRYRCKKPEHPAHGQRECYDTRGEYMHCRFSCDQPYKLEGDEVIYCQKGKWTSKAPTCKNEFKCKEPETQAPLRKDCEDIREEDMVCRFKCDKPYKLDGDKAIFCERGKWDIKFPTCIIEKCKTPANPDHGHVNCNDRQDVCDFTCESDYNIFGNRVIVCRDGEWDKEAPTCRKVPDGKLHDCAAIKKKDAEATTKMYDIWPKNMNKSIQVQCDMTTDGGGWTIFQIRGDFSEKENFYREWVDYVKGFGAREKDHEYWIGLDAIYAISNYEPQTLRVDMGDFDGQRKFAKYSTFSIGSGDEYKLQVSGFSGDAGDSMWAHNAMRFSTKDHGNTYCPNLYKGGWWYNLCHHANLNGLYLRGTTKTLGEGINWFTFRGWWYSLKSTEMKIRPKSYS